LRTIACEIGAICANRGATDARSRSRTMNAAGLVRRTRTGEDDA
jgi:hypothetical protein